MAAPVLGENCNLCLKECTENATKEASTERFQEILDFVFTFMIVCHASSKELKVCRNCYDYIIQFHDYAMQVKLNQETSTHFVNVQCVVKVEPIFEDACSIKKEPIQTPPGSGTIFSPSFGDRSAMKIEPEEGAFTINSANADAHESEPTETSIDAPKRRRRQRVEKQIPCKQCGDSFANLCLLREHMKSHIDCPICGELFPTRRLRREHMGELHKDEGSVICDKCGKTLRRGNLESHNKVYHRVEPLAQWTCKICLESFNNSATLRSHRRSIHDEAGQTFTCDVCQRTYRTSRSLKVHKHRVHVEEKFCCEICQKMFKRSITLKEHMAAHTGVMLYYCDVCGLTFNSNANMYAHRKRKHPIEWQAKQKVVKPCVYDSGTA